MYCGQCGTENSDSAEICALCGVPLTRGNGTRTCAECQSPVGDIDPYCMSCGARLSDQNVQFESGPSFVDDSDLEFERDDLPPWLRDLADERAARVAADDSAGEVDLDDLMNGNSSPRDDRSDLNPDPSSESPIGGTRPGGSAADFNLISDDDLPDWLRELGDEDDTPIEAEPVLVRESSRPTLDLEQSLQVSRAWKQSGRRADETAVSNARSQFMVTSTLTAVHEDEHLLSSSATSPDRASDDGASSTASEEASESQPDERKRKVRLLILFLAIIVLAMLLYMVLAG